MANKKSSQKKTNKKVVKAASKMAKKDPKGFLIILIVVLLIVGLGIGGYFLYVRYLAPQNEGTSSEPESSLRSERPTTSWAEGDVAPIDINFLELGNKYTGDCTFIKAGDTDILIDAGSRNGSASTISAFVDTYCTDGILEYVIATHAHQDHIAGFVGTNSAEGIFKHYKIGTLIDFSQITTKLANNPTAIYTNYTTLRDEKIASGDITHHFYASECVKEEKGAKRIYDLAPGITMEILDQKYYHEKSDDENDHSVCTMLSQGNNHYLFTGDLEEKGEASLVALNDLPQVELFKGGHHGSYTANTDTLLNAIKPKTICICCCAGSDEYTSNEENMFPAQAAINRMGKWTDKIYVTTVVSTNSQGYESMNGNINFHSDKGESYVVTGSNNSTILKETDWFRNKRTWPSA